MTLTDEQKKQADHDAAMIIHEQMGGRRFTVMTGCKPLYFDGPSITYKLSKNASPATRLTITLKANDTYHMKFYRIKGRLGNYETVIEREHDGVYFDQLQELFTKQTGLYTRL